MQQRLLEDELVFTVVKNKVKIDDTLHKEHMEICFSRNKVGKGTDWVAKFIKPNLKEDTIVKVYDEHFKLLAKEPLKEGIVGSYYKKMSIEQLRELLIEYGYQEIEPIIY